MAKSLMTLNGVVHGKTVAFDREIGLPDGQRVTVTVTPHTAGGDVESLRRAFGGWSDDPSGLDDFLEHVRASRKFDRKCP